MPRRAAGSKREDARAERCRKGRARDARLEEGRCVPLVDNLLFLPLDKVTQLRWPVENHIRDLRGVTEVSASADIGRMRRTSR